MFSTLHHGSTPAACLRTISSSSRISVRRSSGTLSQRSLRHLTTTSSSSTVSGSTNRPFFAHCTSTCPTPFNGPAKAALSTTMALREFASQHGLATPNEAVVVHHEYEPKTGSWQYIVADASTKNATIIDPVLDYDAATATITTKSADSLLAIVKENGYNVQLLLETHAHADHLTAADYLKAKLGETQATPPSIGIGKRIVDVQEFWARRFGVPEEEYRGAFDKLLDDFEHFNIGSLKTTAIHLPGHTPDHMGYLIGDNIFVGDSIFHADLGSARADFPGGDARTLFRSGKNLLSLPDDVKIWSGHDYPPEGKQGREPCMTVRDQRESNKHMKSEINEDEFVALREQRDATLAQPKLINQALQMNIRAGKLPQPSPSGMRMLHIPLKLDNCQW